MGKNRDTKRNKPGNSNNGDTPRVSDMSIPDSRDTITELPQQETGQRDIINQKTDKIQEELNNLYYDVYEIESEAKTMQKQYYDSRDKLQSLRETLEQRQNDLNDAQIEDLKYQIEKASNQMRNDLEDAEKAQQKLDETNRRIFELETGSPDYNPQVNWSKAEIDDIDHGL